MNQDFILTNIKCKPNEKLEEFSINTEILFQLEGYTELYIDGKIHKLKAGNIVIINRNKSYYVKNKENGNNVLIKLEINNKYFFSIYEDFLSSKFELYPNEEKRGSTDAVQELRSQLAKFIMYYSNSSSTKNISLSITLNKIVLNLISYFKKEENLGKNYIKSENIINILKYIEKNYYEEISIEQLAKDNYMSPSSFSRLFKEKTGKLFSKYLNETRVNKSLMDLLYSSLSIEEIAVKNGFGNGRTYRRRFREVFDKSPTEFRENAILETGEKEEEDFNIIFKKSSTALETLYYFISSQKENISQENIVENNRKIVIESKINRKQILPSKIIHLGSLDMLLEESVFEELKMVEKDIGVDFIGISSLFEEFPSSYLMDPVEKDNVFSEYGRLDFITKYLIKSKIGYFYQLNLDDLKNRKNNNYFRLISYIKSIKNAYGRKVLKKFRINCIFNRENIEENYNQFKLVFEECKLIDEYIEVGASIPCVYPDYDFIDENDEKIYTKDLIPLCNFLSFTSEPNKIYDYSKNNIANMDFFNEFVYKETLKIKSLVDRWNVDKPLILSEWNTLTGEKQSTNGMFFRAAIILQEILKLDLIIESYGFWINAGVYKNYKLDKKNKYIGLELFHNYSGKKPVYHVLSLSSRLKGNVKFLGKECMLLQNDDKYQLLLWNPNYFNPKLSEEIRFLESKVVLYNIEILDMESNKYQVKRFDLSRTYGAIYYLFKDFKSLYPIDLESREYITSGSKPKMSVFDADIKEDFTYSFVLDTNGIILLEFTPKYYEGI